MQIPSLTVFQTLANKSIQSKEQSLPARLTIHFICALATSFPVEQSDYKAYMYLSDTVGKMSV